MSSVKLAIPLLSLLALLPARGIAQGTCGGSPLSLRGFAAGSGDLVIGEWSEYITFRDGVPIPTMGFRVFATEAPWEGKPLRWIELWMDRSGDRAMRVAADGGKEILLVKRGRSIYSIPPGSAGAGACSPSDKVGQVDDVSLKTVAGVFHCRHSRETRGNHTTEVWTNEGIQPLQLVKASFSSGLGYELIGRGSGAASAFPQRFIAAPLPTMDMLKGLLPVDPHSKKAEPKPAADKGVDAGTP